MTQKKRKAKPIVAVVIALVLLVVLAASWLVWDWHNQRNRHNPADSQTTHRVASDNKTPEGSTKSTVPTFDKTQYSIDDVTSPWVVVNKSRPLNPKDYAPTDLVSVGSGKQLRAAAAEALSQMLGGAKEAGYTVTAASAYRSYDRQVTVYNNEVKLYGQAVADSESARPGTSEHQTGWAVDLSSGGCSVEDCFGKTAGGIWITEHAAEYGFVLRYPADKQAITGYRHETWHFRYVGKELAEEMKKQHIETLEEFFGLPAAPDYI